MAILKQSTLYQRSFLLVESSDHVTGLTGASPTIGLSKNGGSFAAQSSPNFTEIGDGWYYTLLSTTDTNTQGDLAYHITATSADPTDFVDQVQVQVFTDLSMNAAGRVNIINNLQQNTALNGFTFPMTSSATGQIQTGLTVTAKRTLGGGGFAPCTNPVTEITGTGIYNLNLAAADVNSATVGLLFTATGANTLFVPLVPTP